MKKWFFWLLALGVFCSSVDDLFNENWGCGVFPQTNAQLDNVDGIMKVVLPAWGGFDLWTKTAVSAPTNPNKFNVLVKAAKDAPPLTMSFPGISKPQGSDATYTLSEFDNDFKLFKPFLNRFKL